MNPVLKSLRSLRAFGVRRMLNQADYLIKVKSGYYHRTMKLRPQSQPASAGIFTPLPTGSPEQLFRFLEGDSLRILENAGDLLRNQYHPYNSREIKKLTLEPLHPEQHWSAIQNRSGDIKDIWEPARFCWAPLLCRAYQLNHDPVYPQFFYQQVAAFNRLNPENGGENWVSAQEAAIRLIMVVFSAGVLSDRGLNIQPELTQFIEVHARRILPTRNYAAAQNNNHLLSEAAGLMTAGCVLKDHANAEKWFRIGWRDFQRALRSQILPDGAYIQHSTNYHRLMLQLVLWVDLLLKTKGIDWQPALAEKIRRSILWLNAHTDQRSSSACNSGHNDGALLFSFDGNFSDYKSTLQAASSVFMKQPLFEPGNWDELQVWLSCHPRSQGASHPLFENTYYSKNVLRIDAGTEWGMLHTAGFKDRPAHADQLHVSLWRGGSCKALDAGTYRYSAPAPWNNGLKSAFIHNGLTIDGKEPMQDAGQFLWLDWDQARMLEHSIYRVSAEHKGYRKLGCCHQRILEKTRDAWLITDQVTPTHQRAETGDSTVHRFQLHWLLPNKPFEIRQDQNRWIFLSNEERIFFDAGETALNLTIIHGGKTIYPETAAKSIEKAALFGWYSRTYSEREPVLSLVLQAEAALPFQITTNWQFFYPEIR